MEGFRWKTAPGNDPRLVKKKNVNGLVILFIVITKLYVYLSNYVCTGFMYMNSDSSSILLSFTIYALLVYAKDY